MPPNVVSIIGRLIRYRQGGTAGYGLRRMLVDQHGNSKGILALGEYKSIQTDRVILVPGPPEEVATVGWIYDMFVNEGKSEMETARILNSKGHRTDLERSWNRGVVQEILSNEKYIGNNVYNKTSFKLKKTFVKNPPQMWIRTNGAFEAIVDPQLFYKAQGIIMERNRKFSNEEMLDRLKLLYVRKGQLSGLLIDETDTMPSSSAYRHRFGSLIRAYRLIGYNPERDYQYLQVNRFLRDMYPQVLADVFSKIENLGGIINYTTQILNF